MGHQWGHQCGHQWGHPWGGPHQWRCTDGTAANAAVPWRDRLPYAAIQPGEENQKMLSVTQNMVLPTAITGS